MQFDPIMTLSSKATDGVQQLLKEWEVMLLKSVYIPAAVLGSPTPPITKKVDYFGIMKELIVSERE